MRTLERTVKYHLTNIITLYRATPQMPTWVPNYVWE